MKHLFFLLSMLMTFGLCQDFSPNEDDELIFECYMNFTGSSSCTNPNLAPGKYYLNLSGTYGYNNNTDTADAAQTFAGHPTCRWAWNEYCPQGDDSYAEYRPTPDVYNEEHI